MVIFARLTIQVDTKSTWASKKTMFWYSIEENNISGVSGEFRSPVLNPFGL